MEGTRGDLEGTPVVEPEVIDLVEEDMGEDITILYERMDDDVQCIKEIRTIQEDSEDDELVILEVLGVKGQRGDASEVDGISGSKDSSDSACDVVEEEGLLNRRFSEVVADTVTPSTSSREVQSEGIASTSTPQVTALIGSYNDFEMWPSLQPLSKPCSLHSSVETSPSSRPESQLEIEVGEQDTFPKIPEAEANQFVEELVTRTGSAAPLHEEEMSNNEMQSEDKEEITEVPMASSENDAIPEVVVTEVVNQEEKQTEDDAPVPPEEVVDLEKEHVEAATAEEIRRPLLCHWDTWEDVNIFAEDLDKMFDQITQEKKEGKLKKKGYRKTVRKVISGNVEEVRSQRTRLGNRVIAPRCYADGKKSAMPPCPSSSKRSPVTNLSKKERKRKVPEVAEDENALVMEVASPASLCRPSTSRRSSAQLTGSLSPSCSSNKDKGWVEGDHWEVEEIVADKSVIDSDGQKSYEYKVKWKGWDDKDSSWVSEKDLNADKILEKYWKRVKRNANKSNPKIEKVGRRASYKSVRSS